VDRTVYGPYKQRRRYRSSFTYSAASKLMN